MLLLLVQAEELAAFLACMLAFDPTHRWTAKQLLSHPYLQAKQQEQQQQKTVKTDPKG